MKAVYGDKGPDVRILKVRFLQGRLREQADDKGLNPEDLALVTTTIEKGKHPPVQYEIEKVEGDPVSFLLKRAAKEREKEGGRAMRSEDEIKKKSSKGMMSANEEVEGMIIKLGGIVIEMPRATFEILKTIKTIEDLRAILDREEEEVRRGGLKMKSKGAGR